VSFAAITVCVASQRVFIVVVYFVIGSVRKLLDIPSYMILEERDMKFWKHCIRFLVCCLQYGDELFTPLSSRCSDVGKTFVTVLAKLKAIFISYLNICRYLFSESEFDDRLC
jgi:hypothetical protein